MLTGGNETNHLKFVCNVKAVWREVQSFDGDEMLKKSAGVPQHVIHITSENDRLQSLLST